MGFKLGQKIIDKIRQKKEPFWKRIFKSNKVNKYIKIKNISNTPIKHQQQGTIYYPYYNLAAPLVTRPRDIFNANGEKMDIYFIRDIHFAHDPYQESQYFLWDRYNYSLDTHFYSHNMMLQTIGNPSRRYGCLIESQAIVPEDYKIFDKNKGLEQDFDYIFTYDERLLDKLDNARFVPFCASLWNKELITDDLYQKKSKNISILSSDKLMCDMHKFRYDLAFTCKNYNLADTFGTFDGGPFVNISKPLLDYRFSICVENDITPYFFTERLINALASQTIPVYFGATQIDKFFNPDGIIKFDLKSDIKEVLKQCTPEEYERRLPAIKDNYERALSYASPFDNMYKKYLER